MTVLSLDIVGHNDDNNDNEIVRFKFCHYATDVIFTFIPQLRL